MKSRLTNRIRHSNPQLESLPIENIGRSRRGLSMEISSSISDETINKFHYNQLLEAIRRIEKENKNLKLENILYSWYLRRVENSKILETYDDYNDENDGVLPERLAITNQTTIQVKLPDIARRSSVKRAPISSSKSSPLWSKLVSNWRQYIYTPYLLRVEQEKLSIAAYEIEQIQLDWERMKTNADLTLGYLDDLLRAVEFDETAQENLIADFQKNINKLRYYVKEEKSINSPFFVPAELIIHRINKRIHSNISSISLLRINTTQTQLHIRYLDTIIHSLDDQRDKIDLNFVRTRKIDYLDTYEKLDRKYKLEKSSQYPLLNRLQKYKQILFEQEQEKCDYEYRYEFLENYCEKLQQEIQSIQSETKFIFNENLRIKTRITGVKNVPTITDYAHIIDQTKKLQHEIHIWTQRVAIAQTLLGQTKSPNVLPMIKSSSIIRTSE